MTFGDFTDNVGHFWESIGGNPNQIDRPVKEFI